MIHADVTDPSQTHWSCWCNWSKSNITDPADVTDQIKITDHVGVTDQIVITDHVGVNDQVKITDHADVTDQIKITDHVGVTNQVEITDHADLLINQNHWSCWCHWSSQCDWSQANVTNQVVIRDHKQVSVIKPGSLVSFQIQGQGWNQPGEMTWNVHIWKTKS